MMNPQGGSSSSFFTEEVGARKMEVPMAGYVEGAISTPFTNRIPSDSQVANGFALADYNMSGGRNVNLSLGRHVIGAERASSRSLPKSVDRDLGSGSKLNTDSVSCLFDGDKLNLMGAQHENSLFSSSLSDLFSRNLKLQSKNAAHSHSVVSATALTSHYEEEEAFELLEELAAKTINTLLPDDDDLLSGVTDGFDNITRHNNGEEMEDLDLFNSVGGLELGDDSLTQRNSEISDMKSNNYLPLSMGLNGARHPSGEYPSRTLFVRNINSNVEDSELRAVFEQYGDLRTLFTACKQRGFVMISYYDIRAACNAMKILQNKPFRRRKLDIHFSIPKENPSEKDINQGILEVFNLDSSISNDEFHEIFGVHGDIMEIRESVHRSDHKFIEFYDLRAAESALRALSKAGIAGKLINLEPGHPGGSKRLLQHFSSEEQDESGTLVQQHSPSNSLSTGFSAGLLSFGDVATRADNVTMQGPFPANGGPINQNLDNVLHPAVSATMSNCLPSLARVEPGHKSGITESAHLNNHLKFELHRSPNLLPHSLTEYPDILASGQVVDSPNNMAANISSCPPELLESQQFRRVNSSGHPIDLPEVFSSSGNGSCPPPGRHYMWSSSHPRPQAVMWPGSPSFVNGIGTHPQPMHAIQRAPSHIMNGLMPPISHHMGSAPSVNPSLWDRRPAYAGESPDATVFHPGSVGSMRIAGTSPHPLEFVPHNIFPTGGNCMDMPIPPKNIALHAHHQRCLIFPTRGQMHPMMSSFDSPCERTRNRRTEGSSSQPDNKKQFELDIDRILRGEDKRTTLMIKNIPNKYTSKMLLAAIDERHKGTYDFIYLPIDFKNKCNVGYAFINMTDPSFIVPFYQTFNGKKWEKFNSEKVASLAYARIQGKAALVAHFQNSSLMNEDKRCRPILFHTDGPNAGDQVPFPMGTNIRPRPGKTRTSSSEEHNQEILTNSLTGDDHLNGDSSSASGKESD